MRGRIFPILGGRSYQQRVKSLFDLAYWPLDEAAGTTVNDRSGNNRQGTYANVTLGQPGAGDGKTCPLFGAASSRADVSSAPLIAASGWTEYGVSMWVKVANAGVWTDAAMRWGLLLINSSDQISIYRSGANNQVTWGSYISATAALSSFDYMTTTGWMHFGITGSLSNNRVRTFFNGYQVGTAAFNGGLTPNSGMTIGSRYIFDQNWSGWLAHVGLAKHELSAADMMTAATIGYKPVCILHLGDSIAANSPLTNYPNLLWNNYRRGKMINRAVGGASIMASMAGQVAAAAGDNAGIILIELGTNDADDPAITATYTAQLNALKASNPKARIYGLGILPRTTGFIAANNGRIHQACDNANCTYLDPAGWIDPATDTGDGVHPTTAGYVKIFNQLTALI